MPQRPPIETAESGARIWILSPDWKTRTLVRAQLIEEGYEVTAMEGWQSLQELLSDEIVAPRLVIAELTGQEPPETVSLLRTMPVPRLVLRGAGASDAETLRAWGVNGVLSRPYRVGDIVRAAADLLKAEAFESYKGS